VGSEYLTRAIISPSGLRFPGRGIGNLEVGNAKKQ